MKQTDHDASSVVIKLGTSTLTQANRPNLGLIAALCTELRSLRARGLRPVVTTSGAVQLGVARGGGAPGGAALPRAGLAAIGQLHLMAAFAQCLAPHGHRAAQMLLKADDLRCGPTRTHLAEAIGALSASDAIVLVNENDATAAVAGFPSNDELSAALAGLLRASKLIIFTDRPGVYHADPRVNPDAPLFGTVAADDARLHAAASPAPTATGTGGMKSKIDAARAAANGGATTVITRYEPGALGRIVAGERLGTWIVPPPPHRFIPSNPNVELEEESRP
ncbi:amino acid kinase family protein [Burkholderia plantarii]|uniref:amino acid kinase family protein n=1 Tax=Burkholderia plantarii TaxID=41899 RepID=UPI0008708800|nr:hypothetical protein [Burkholderia plantarii]